jgi:hypothetical protein
VFLSILAEVGLVQDAATLLQRMQQRQRRRRGGPAPAPRLQGQQGQTSEALANLSQRLRVYVVVAVDICFEVAQQGAEMLRLTAPPATEPRAGGSGGGGGAASATAAAGGALLLARGQAVAVLRQLEQAQAQCTRSLQLEVQSIHEGHAALLSPRLARLTQEMAAAALAARAAVHAWQAAGGSLPAGGAGQEQPPAADELHGDLLAPPVPAEQLLLRAEEALATRACANLACTSCVGSSEAGTPQGKRCRGCRTVRFCGAACQAADWARHKPACRLLAAGTRQ